MNHSLKIRDLQLQARLGCSQDERSIPQEVRVSVEIRFAEAPKGHLSDQLDDTVCYAKISDALRAHLADREFNLVEKMASDFYGILKTKVAAQTQISVTVHKVKPPVENLLGGVEYRIGDFA